MLIFTIRAKSYPVFLHHFLHMMRGCSLFFLSFCSLTILGLTGCSAPNSQTPTPQNQITTQPQVSPGAASSALFEDVAARAGLKYRHQVSDTKRLYFVELTAPGCAFIDYDNDGHLDIFLVQSGSSQPAAKVKQRALSALYHNNGDGSFSDVTANSGLDKDLGYGHGVAVGDYDNDGNDDLFITAYGGNHLLRNRGKGKFEDVTKALGLAKPHGSTYATSAAWGDYDGDGRLDLYVCYYAVWNHATDIACTKDGKPDYCHPKLYEPMTHRLYHNSGQGFVDVSQKSGIAQAKGRGLAVAWTDYNGDRRPDIFVANDITPSMLWRNNGNGTFTNMALQTGTAYDGEGILIAGMGIGVADYDRSGRESLYVSNFVKRPNILFKNNGNSFDDSSSQARLGMVHLDYLSWGCEFFDYDADGWQDLIVNNGDVLLRTALQRKQLLHNEANGTFREITDPAQLDDLATPTRGRGLATGDYDNDGSVDVLAMSQNAPAQLFRNQKRNTNHWISFQTVGVKSNRNGIHTRFQLEAGGAKQTATVRSGSSYLSSSDRRVYFGLGAQSKIDRVTVDWPGGKREIFKNLSADTFYTLTEGRGITARKKPQS